jgi:hypothetical protein
MGALELGLGAGIAGVAATTLMSRDLSPSGIVDRMGTGLKVGAGVAGLGLATLGGMKFAETAKRMGGYGKAGQMYGRFAKMKANQGFNAIKSTMKGLR